MNGFTIKDRNSSSITDWRAWTRPKKVSQWRAGRSSMELARAWFVSASPRCPREVMDLLATNVRTANVVLLEAFPEHVTPLVERGEGRNHDLLLLATGDAGPVVISVEAKVDEPFGDETIGEYWARARRSKDPTRAPERIRALLQMVFGSEASADADPWSGLRYQLLTATAGTAIEAARAEAGLAVLVVHEFLTEDIDSGKVDTNAKDLAKFVAVLLKDSGAPLISGRLAGPIALGPNAWLSRRIELLIGKAVFDWRLKG